VSNEYLDQEDDIEDQVLIICPSCFYENAPIGRLGAVLHFCCRYCGLWYRDRIDQ